MPSLSLNKYDVEAKYTNCIYDEAKFSPINRKEKRNLKINNKNKQKKLTLKCVNRKKMLMIQMVIFCCKILFHVDTLYSIQNEKKNNQKN